MGKTETKILFNPENVSKANYMKEWYGTIAEANIEFKALSRSKLSEDRDLITIREVRDQCMLNDGEQKFTLPCFLSKYRNVDILYKSCRCGRKISSSGVILSENLTC